ncbi:hypothetical protein K438DRAFT_1758202 [Mycena galopus ATCC 62051]|nr:hypothetical protein K438DRAFT_1758202 [Mycena galopus ATCC 62051]
MWLPCDPHTGYPDRESPILGVEALFNGPFRLPAPLEPVLFHDADGSGDFDCFVFHDGEGTYYFYDHDRRTVRRYHGRFHSHYAFLHAQFDSFDEEAPVSTRASQLYARQCDLSWGPHSLTATEKAEQLKAVKQEREIELRNPPPNVLYTELFPEREDYKVMVVVAPKI